MSAVLVLTVAGVATGQGIPTGTITGKVTLDAQGLPGVSVTATSPALQGSRTTVTGASGGYILANLPPGDYTIKYELSGLDAITRVAKASPGLTSTVDTELKATGVTAEATATAIADQVSQETQGSASYEAELVQQLPVTRTLRSIVELAPGVNTSGPRSAGVGGLSISGAQSFENLFTVDGVVMNENLRGQPLSLFIEDAIQETTVTQSSVSAEYGRFSGGVVNALTKSGGNRFSGSFRTTLNNEKWGEKTPSNEALVDKTNPRYEATLGGPIWKDRIWFFGAIRLEDSETGRQTQFTNLSYNFGRDERRYEGKLTLTPFDNHTLTGAYVKIDDVQSNDSFSTQPLMDFDSLYDRETPQELVAINYNGVLTSNLFIEAQYSKRDFTFIGSGSKFTDEIRGTLMLDQSRGNARYHAPTFCGVCDPEERDNENFLVKGNLFLSSEKLGSHNIVLGYDNFTGTRKANNYQSGSNYRVYTTESIIRGTEIFPVFDSSTYFFYQPIPLLSQGSDVLTHSVFLNDSWRVSDRLSVNLGLRYDKNDVKDSRGFTTADDSNISPRIAAAFDVTGDGKLRVNASYARYVAGIQENQINAGSNAGNSATYYWYYDGPGATPINTDPNATNLVSTEQALQQFFTWFHGQGCPDLSTCQVPLDGSSLPGVNRQIQSPLSSPHADELSVGVNGTLFGKGAYRVDVVRREWKDMYSVRIDQSTGQVTNATGRRFDLGVIENSSILEREYTGLHTQLQFRPFTRLNLGASWTWSHTIGNFDGETAASGSVQGTPVFYPEFSEPEWNFPRGSLASDQRHRVRAHATFDVPMPQVIGNLSFGIVQSFDSGTPYGAVAAVNSFSYVDPNLAATPPNPNRVYEARPSSVNYYFTARDAFLTDDTWQTDIALNYSKRIGPVEIFVQPQVRNVFDNQAVQAVNTTVQTRTQVTGFLPFNPFTDVPVQGARAASNAAATANWNYGATFGQARSKDDYQNPRLFRVSLGLRF